MSSAHTQDDDYPEIEDEVTSRDIDEIQEEYYETKIRDERTFEMIRIIRERKMERRAAGY